MESEYKLNELRWLWASARECVVRIDPHADRAVTARHNSEGVCRRMRVCLLCYGSREMRGWAGLWRPLGAGGGDSAHASREHTAVIHRQPLHKSASLACCGISAITFECTAQPPSVLPHDVYLFSVCLCVFVYTECMCQPLPCD